jgi:hypothetical protein
MTDAPERIWAWKWTGERASGQWFTHKTADASEYIRADLVDARDAAWSERVAALEAAVAAARVGAADWRAIAMRLLKAGDALAQACDDGEPTIDLVNAWGKAVPPMRSGAEASK